MKKGDEDRRGIDNRLFAGDNLAVLREHFPDDSADLVYLDPPFKTNKSHRHTERGGGAQAFGDTWRFDERAWKSIAMSREMDQSAGETLEGLVSILGPSDMTAYLAMMAPRLIELRRVMKPHASLYLHCDPRASHYLKVLMDAVFSPKSFRNEIVWHYRRWTNAQRQYQNMHDIILFYREPGGGTFNLAGVDPTPSQARVIERGWNVNKVRDGDAKALQLLVYDREKFDAAVTKGRLNPDRYDRVVFRDEKKSALSDTWTDIQFLHSQAKERLGYPTQKPLALLERIALVSSAPGELVLDPFCGSGTTLAAAASLGRRYAGIDSNPAAVEMSRRRLEALSGAD